MPEVAVMIPAYNAARFLGETLESVAAQTLQPAEVIVADDGSTDETAEVAERFPWVKLIRLPHRGTSAARNAAVAASSAPFLALLDADDIWAPQKLQRQMEFARANPGVVLVLAHQDYKFDVPVPGWFRGPTDGGWEPGILPSNWFMPRSTWELVGPFDESITFGEDTDWFARARDLGVTLVTVPEVLVTHRIHDANTMGKGQPVRTGVLAALRSSVQRKREATQDD